MMAKSIKYPDFFILGAPKCGTSSLYRWLSGHPDIYICDPREPNYYSYLSGEIPRSRASATCVEDYDRLFKAACQGQLIGDCSTSYLRSKEAVPLLLRDNPAARLIVCLRNPIEMAPSCHAQLLKSGSELERNFALAWSKSTRYRETCLLGKQVETLLEHAHREQIIFLLSEDMQRDARSSYLSTLQFLGVDDDGRREFHSENVRLVPRNTLLPVLANYAYRLKHRLGVHRRLGLWNRFSHLNLRSPSAEETSVPVSIRADMNEFFRDDVQKLAVLIDRNLDHWLTPSS